LPDNDNTAELFYTIVQKDFFEPRKMPINLAKSYKDYLQKYSEI